MMAGMIKGLEWAGLFMKVGALEGGQEFLEMIMRGMLGHTGVISDRSTKREVHTTKREYCSGS
jgi:hypothetical protein